MSAPMRVAIHYRRLPDQLRVYDQRVVHTRDDVIVTLSEPLDLEAPMLHRHEVMLEQGSLAVWFTFPGIWHDIGRFHRADGAYTGTYANILTPPQLDGTVWHTTDLFLDVWWAADGSPELLDEDELAAALEAGHIEPHVASRARAEAARVMARAREGDWPPEVVEEWTLERSLEALSSPPRTPTPTAPRRREGA